MAQADTDFGWNTAEAQDDHAYTLPAIRELLPQGRLRILDAGCGNGYVASQLAADGHDVIAIDQAEDGISLAKECYPDVDFEVRSVYDDVSDIASNMDVVISSEVIEHLYSPQRFLQNMRRHIKPGGYLILTTPYHGYLKNLALSVFNAWDKHHTVAREGGHIKFFSQPTLSLMLKESGYGDVQFNNAGRVRWLWKSMICRVRVTG